jgi:hypothetical protein
VVELAVPILSRSLTVGSREPQSFLQIKECSSSKGNPAVNVSRSTFGKCVDILKATWEPLLKLFSLHMIQNSYSGNSQSAVPRPLFSRIPWKLAGNAVSRSPLGTTRGSRNPIFNKYLSWFFFVHGSLRTITLRVCRAASLEESYPRHLFTCLGSSFCVVSPGWTPLWSRMTWPTAQHLLLAVEGSSGDLT